MCHLKNLWRWLRSLCIFQIHGVHGILCVLGFLSALVNGFMGVHNVLGFMLSQGPMVLWGLTMSMRFIRSWESKLSWTSWGPSASSKFMGFMAFTVSWGSLVPWSTVPLESTMSWGLSVSWWSSDSWGPLCPGIPQCFGELLNPWAPQCAVHPEVPLCPEGLPDPQVPVHQCRFRYLWDLRILWLFGVRVTWIFGDLNIFWFSRARNSWIFGVVILEPYISLLLLPFLSHRPCVFL